MMEFRNLDDRTRLLMMEELERDLENNLLYFSRRLNEHGLDEYVGILKRAITGGSPDSFADELSQRRCLKTHEKRRKPKGEFTTVKVPITAADTLAEGEFNRFYIRALCRGAIDEGIDHIVVYRAKEVRDPRPEERK